MHRGRTVLAMDCVLAGAKWHRARPLNSVVRRPVTFAIEMDTGALWTFASPEEAMTYCEIDDVLTGNWKFFADSGVPLQPKIDRGRHVLGIPTGYASYDLTEGMLTEGANLSAYLPSVRYLERGSFRSIDEVREYLNQRGACQ